MTDDVLDTFLPATRTWFRERYGETTPPQALGWPAIQRGENTLILSPTGSGKTLAAFLWGIDRIFRSLMDDPELKGVQLLYISPLKALNNDIARNLSEPLAGIRRTARAMGIDLPQLRTAVRTGDTPQSARRRMVTDPPHILITTPESFYLILTSPRARAMLRPVGTVIVDEIHTLCGNKRGVHLALSLERLTHLRRRPFQRIGLSATQRPLDEVARFLVGQEWVEDEAGEEQLVSREVTIVDAGMRKAMDLKVVTVLPDLRHLPGGSIWPSLIPRVLDDVRRHRTTLIFVNGRRGAERAADRLNEQFALEESEELPPGSPTGLLVDGVPKGQGMFGTARVGGPFRAHHGSVSREVRLELEGQLKAGKLPALIATSSLELGIDVGEVDAVVQLQSPRGIARGLQRVGRSGHLVGQTSVGRIYVTHREDLLDAATVAHGMLHGDIEPTHTPQNCLDVLAQQIVAMVSIEDWDVTELHRVTRQAYGYGRFSHDALFSVLRMLTGEFGDPTSVETLRDLRPRVSWDRVNNKIAALPAARMLALRNGGTIADRGEFRVYLPDGKTMLGTLDEEFVYETKRGDIFTLGSSTWRVLEIDEDKMVVAQAPGALPRMPFWHGELPKRDYHMGRRLGEFRRQLSQRVRDLPSLPDDPDAEWPAEAGPVIAWLEDEYCLDEFSARNAILHVGHQLHLLGSISTDTTLVIELFNDALGDPRMVIHSPFGAPVNSAWALALSHALRERFGVDLETQVSDDGILFHFAQIEGQAPIDLVTEMRADEARERLLLELPNSAMFGAHFRMNASRALLLPGLGGRNRRTPFWLQRLRSRNLLAAVKRYDDFPMVIETYRTCLSDVLDLEHLVEVLGEIESGVIRMVVAETIVPSTVAASLLSEFMAEAMYEWDQPKLERQIQALSLNRELLAELLDEDLLPNLLRPQAIEAVVSELQHIAEGYKARTPEELAVMLRELGDLSADEVGERSLGEGRAWLLRLAAEGRTLQIDVPTATGPKARWTSAEHYWRYRDAFGLCEIPPAPIPAELLEPVRSVDTASEALLRALFRTRGPLTHEELLARYAFPRDWLVDKLDELVGAGHLVIGRITPGASEKQWCDRHVLERIHRRTLSLLRKEVQAVELFAYSDFMLRWQGLHPGHRLSGEDGLLQACAQLRGLPAPAVTWDRDLLPLRVEDYDPKQLDDLCAEGDLVWVGAGTEASRARARLFFRGEGSLFLTAPDRDGSTALSEEAAKVRQFIQEEGASFASDIREGLLLGGADLDRSLVELLLAGLVTNDRFETMRIAARGDWTQADSRGIESSLDGQLSEWRAARKSASALSRPPKGRLHRARREVARRVSPLTNWPGRWSLVHRIGVWGREIADEERADRQARQLLHRYGIVTRECLEHETLGHQAGAMGWGPLYRQLQFMEMRGEVRRGYFVRGLSGVQFALPEALERLREWNKEEAEGVGELVLVNAWDPALLYGPALSGRDRPGADLPEGRNPYRVTRLPSNYLVLQRGVPVLLFEHGGGRWTTLPGASEEILLEATRLLMDHLTREDGICSLPRRVVVSTWDGAPPLGGEGQSLLETLRFRREALDMVWDGL